MLDMAGQRDYSGHMTYIADLDPENRTRAAEQAATEAWDAECPEWRELSIDPERRRYVPEESGSAADETIIRGYGSDHRGVLSFGRDEQPW